MKLSHHRRHNGKRIFLFSIVLAALTACGGGDPLTNSETPLQPPAFGSSAECFNSDLTRAGTTFEFRYEISLSGAPIGSSVETGSISDGASFNGGTDLLRQQSKLVTTIGSVVSEQTEDAFFRWQTSSMGPVQYDYGGIIEKTDRGVVTKLELKFDPIAQLREFTLGVNESYVYAANGKLTATVNGISTEEDSEYSERVTYLGQETIRVSAGEFTACAFRGEDLIANDTRIVYISKGSGIPILFSGTDDKGNPGRSELKSGSKINGAVIVPQ